MSLANDTNSIPVRVLGGNAQLISGLRASGFKNVIAVDKTNFASGNIQESVTFVGEEEPSTNYDRYAKIGDKYLMIQFTSGAPSIYKEYIRVSGPAWGEVICVPQSTSVVRATGTDSKKEIDVQGASSSSGDYRAVYAKISLSHATAGSGDALRGYAVTTGGANACRGAHLTGEVGAGGSVTGTICGATLQLTTVSGLTISGGTYACLDIVSDLSSAISGATKASFIRVSELQTNKVPFWLNIESSVTGCIGATTAANAAGTLKVNHAGTTKYIQLFSAAS